MTRHFWSTARAVLPAIVLISFSSSPAFALKPKQPKVVDGSGIVLGGDLEEQFETTLRGCPLLAKLSGASLIPSGIFDWALPPVTSPAPPAGKLYRDWVLNAFPTRLVRGMGHLYSTNREADILAALGATSSSTQAIPTPYSDMGAVFDPDVRFHHEESCGTYAKLLNETKASGFGVNLELVAQCINSTKSSLSVTVGTLQNQILADLAAADKDWARGRKAYELLWDTLGQHNGHVYVIDDVQAVFVVSHKLSEGSTKSSISASASWNIGVVGTRNEAKAVIETNSATESTVSRAYVFSALDEATRAHVPDPDRFKIARLPTRGKVGGVLAKKIDLLLSDADTGESPAQFEWDTHTAFSTISAQLLYKPDAPGGTRLHLGTGVCEQKWIPKILTDDGTPVAGIHVNVSTAKVISTNDCKVDVDISDVPPAWENAEQHLKLQLSSSDIPELSINRRFNLLVRKQYLVRVGEPKCSPASTSWTCATDVHVTRRDQKPLDLALTPPPPVSSKNVECTWVDANNVLQRSSPKVTAEPRLDLLDSVVNFTIEPTPAGAIPPWDSCLLSEWQLQIFPARETKLHDSKVPMPRVTFRKP